MFSWRSPISDPDAFKCVGFDVKLLENPTAGGVDSCDRECRLIGRQLVTPPSRDMLTCVGRAAGSSPFWTGLVLAKGRLTSRYAPSLTFFSYGHNTAGKAGFDRAPVWNVFARTDDKKSSAFEKTAIYIQDWIYHITYKSGPNSVKGAPLKCACGRGKRYETFTVGFSVASQYLLCMKPS